MIDRLDELLAEAGVDIGRPERRRERAVRCANEGMVEVDLQELVEWGHATRRKLHTVGHWLGWATSSAVRWRAVLADVRKLKASRVKHQPPPPNQPARPATDATATRDYRLQMTFCRVHGDRASIETVAAEFGVDVATARAWLAEEEQRRGMDQPKPKPQRRASVPPKDEDLW